MIETIGIISKENYKKRTIAIAKGEEVLHPELKKFAESEESAIKNFGGNIFMINLNYL